MSKPEPIEANKLLLAEGRDAELFLVWAVRHFCSEDYSQIQVMDFGGIKELTNFLKLLANDESYEDLETIVIARDAENDAQAAKASIRTSMAQARMPTPQEAFVYAQNSSMKAAFMIFPGPGQNNGTLEDLCLSTVADDPLMECVDTYLECANSKGEQFSRIHKNRLHTFLAGKNRYAGLPVGLASREGAWDFDHPALTSFKTIIQQM